MLSAIVALVLLAISRIHINGLTLSNECDCGYTDITPPTTAAVAAGDDPIQQQQQQQKWTEMWHLDFQKWATSHEVDDIFVASYNIAAKYNGTSNRSFKLQNVFLNGASEGGLMLAVTVDNMTMQCGGFGSRRQDILYGSFRSYIKTTPVSGTVAAMYIFNPEQEIDIELLSAVKPSQAYFAIHPGLLENGRASHLTHHNHFLGFDPTAEFHEYRFDWMPGLAVFYIDGIEAQRLVTNIPTLPSRFMFNHWSDGNPKFSQGPPTENAYMEIMNITAFFNYSTLNPISGLNTTAPPRCQKTKEACSVHRIMEYLKTSIVKGASQSTTTGTVSFPSTATNLSILSEKSSSTTTSHVYLHTTSILVTATLTVLCLASNAFIA